MTSRRRAPKRPPAQPPRWQIIETIIAHIEGAKGRAANWRVTQKALVPEYDNPQARGREIDVFIECPSGERTFRMGVDVKDEARPLAIEAMQTLIAKRQSVALDRYAVIARAGYTAEARRKAQLAGIQLLTFAEAEQCAFLALDTFTFLQRNLDLRHVEVVFAESPGELSLEGLRRALVELRSGERVTLADLATRYGAHHVNSNELNTALSFGLRIVDTDATWRAVSLDSAPLPTIVEMTAVYDLAVREEIVPLTKVVTSDGNEAAAALVTLGEHQRQLVAHKTTDGGVQSTVSMGPARPSPTRVLPESGAPQSTQALPERRKRRR